MLNTGCVHGSVVVALLAFLASLSLFCLRMLCRDEKLLNRRRVTPTVVTLFTPLALL
jgi:hypothetical protein